jgi:hypothetical protein
MAGLAAQQFTCPAQSSLVCTGNAADEVDDEKSACLTMDRETILGLAMAGNREIYREISRIVVMSRYQSINSSRILIPQSMKQGIFRTEQGIGSGRTGNCGRIGMEERAQPR